MAIKKFTGGNTIKNKSVTYRNVYNNLAPTIQDSDWTLVNDNKITELDIIDKEIEFKQYNQTSHDCFMCDWRHDIISCTDEERDLYENYFVYI